MTNAIDFSDVYEHLKNSQKHTVSSSAQMRSGFVDAISC